MLSANHFGLTNSQSKIAKVSKLKFACFELGTAVETLASYLAVNMPLPADAVMAAATLEQLGAAFPPDGKELAIANCQFCHSFFTGYLAHDRDAEGWRGVFKPPYHSELPMSARERETFSLYSATNLPIPYQDVPEELRF